MRNPIPRRFRSTLGNLLLVVLVYLALTGLHAIVDGRAPVPSAFVLVVFAVFSVVAIWFRGAMQEER